MKFYENRFEGEALTNQAVLDWLEKEEQDDRACAVVGWGEDEGFVLCGVNGRHILGPARDLVGMLGQSKAHLCCRVCGSSWVGGPATPGEVQEAWDKGLGGSREFPLPVDRCEAGCPGHLVEWEGAVLAHGLAAFDKSGRTWHENLVRVLNLPDGAEISCSGAYEPLGSVGIYLTGQVTLAASEDVYSDVAEDGRRKPKKVSGVTALRRANYNSCLGTTDGEYSEFFVRRPEVLGLWVDADEDPVTIVRVRETAAKLGLPYVRIDRAQLRQARQSQAEEGVSIDPKVFLDEDPRQGANAWWDAAATMREMRERAAYMSEAAIRAMPGAAAFVAEIERKEAENLARIIELEKLAGCYRE